MAKRFFSRFMLSAIAGGSCAAFYIQSKYVAFEDTYGDAIQLYDSQRMASHYQKTLGGHPITYYSETPLKEQPAAARPLQEHMLKPVDVCVIGGGFAGLHAALALAEKGKSVVVLEAKRVGCRASGRNGGDAIIGFHTEADEIAQIAGEDAARETYGHSVEGYERLKQLIKRYDIKCNSKEDGAVTVAFTNRLKNGNQSVDAALEEERAYAASVKKRFGEELEVWDKATLQKHGFISDRFAYGVFNPRNLTLNPLELVLGLARACRQNGVAIFEASPATSCTRLPQLLNTTNNSSNSNSSTSIPTTEDAPWLITTDMGSVVAKHVILATNGVPPHLSLKLSLATVPLVTGMMLTKPIDKSELDKVLTAKCAIFDERFALAYFRRVEGNRILYGSLAKGMPMDRAWAERALVKDLTATFPSLAGLVEPDISWQGRLEAKLPVFPLIGRDSSGLWFSIGYSGHGLVPTCAAGELLASAIVSLDPKKDGSKSKPDERYKLWGLVSYGPAQHNVPWFCPPTFLPVGGPWGLVASVVYCKWATIKDAIDHKT